MTITKHVSPGGGTRSEQAPAYHLVPRAGIRRTALRFALGARYHGPENWKKSCESEEDALEWCQEAFNHLIEHAMKMSNGVDLSDDHLGAIGWAQSVLCYCEEKFGKPWTLLTKELVELPPSHNRRSSDRRKR